MSPKPTILALNSGSSSLKFGLFDAGACEGLLAGEIDLAGGDRASAQCTLRPRNGSSVTSCLAVPDDFTAAKLAVNAALASGVPGSNGLSAVTLVGHRVVHGGADFQASVLIDAHVKAGIAGLNKLAPLHNPAVLKAIDAVEALLPGVPQVASSTRLSLRTCRPRLTFTPSPTNTTNVGASAGLVSTA